MKHKSKNQHSEEKRETERLIRAFKEVPQGELEKAIHECGAAEHKYQAGVYDLAWE